MENTSTDSGERMEVSHAGGQRKLSAAASLRSALRETVAKIDGVNEVRVLPAERRESRSVNKIYIVLGTHDVDRDRQIIELMSQFDSVDYDLVPSAGSALIPAAATRA